MSEQTALKPSLASPRRTLRGRLQRVDSSFSPYLYISPFFILFGVFGLFYGVAAFLLGALFVWYALELRRSLERRGAVRLFHYSLLYLALLFVAMAVDAVV